MYSVCKICLCVLAISTVNASSIGQLSCSPCNCSSHLGTSLTDMKCEGANDLPHLSSSVNFNEIILINTQVQRGMPGSTTKILCLNNMDVSQVSSVEYITSLNYRHLRMWKVDHRLSEQLMNDKITTLELIYQYKAYSPHLFDMSLLPNLRTIILHNMDCSFSTSKLILITHVFVNNFYIEKLYFKCSVMKFEDNSMVFNSVNKMIIDLSDNYLYTEDLIRMNISNRRGKVSELILKNNHIRYLSMEFFESFVNENPGVKINLDGNELICSCDIYWLFESTFDNNFLNVKCSTNNNNNNTLSQLTIRQLCDTSEDSATDNFWIFIILGAIFASIVIFIIAAYIKGWYCHPDRPNYIQPRLSSISGSVIEMREIIETFENEHDTSDSGESDHTKWIRVENQSISSYQDPLPGDILVNPEHIIIQDLIGSGETGVVYLGQFMVDDMHPIEVALKMSHSNILDNGRYDPKIIEEAVKMKNFNHDNVMSLIGICLKNQKAIIVMPYMKHGDLLTHIRNNHEHITLELLLKFALDIAKGMSYLADKGFIHRDLAARNCLLDNEMTVKICDFSLTKRLLYYESRHLHRIPIRWMAIESMERNHYSTKSDVWSYAVVVWELFSRGQTPYHRVADLSHLKHLLRNSDYRLERPTKCPQMVYRFLTQCWASNRQLRPNFKQIVVFFTNLQQNELD